MSQELAIKPHERAMVMNDLSKLNDVQRYKFYSELCTSLDLNPLTQPFGYIELKGKLTLYAKKDCTEQLRNKRKVSITIVDTEEKNGCYIVRAKAIASDGRTDESIGAVPIAGKNGEDYANAIMKAETKAKRRVTLSICGLGIVDESEVPSIPGARTFDQELDKVETSAPVLHIASIDPKPEAKTEDHSDFLKDLDAPDENEKDRLATIESIKNLCDTPELNYSQAKLNVKLKTQYKINSADELSCEQSEKVFAWLNEKFQKKVA